MSAFAHLPDIFLFCIVRFIQSFWCFEEAPSMRRNKIVSLLLALLMLLSPRSDTLLAAAQAASAGIGTPSNLPPSPVPSTTAVCPSVP